MLVCGYHNQGSQKSDRRVQGSLPMRHLCRLRRFDWRWQFSLSLESFRSGRGGKPSVRLERLRAVGEI